MWNANKFRRPLAFASILALALSASCGGGDDGDGGDDPDDINSDNYPYPVNLYRLDWTKSSCSHMEGNMLDSGACYKACSSWQDCADNAGCENAYTNDYPYCRPYLSKTDCKGKGQADDAWVKYNGGCYIACNADGSCPNPYVLFPQKGNDGTCYCDGKKPSSGGGGGICDGCGGIYCSGRCSICC